jgi:hypothetical protein
VVETWPAEQFILAALSAAPAVAGGRIYQGIAPQGSAFPYVVYQFQGGADLDTLRVVRVWADLVYLVKAVTNASGFAPVRAIANEVDARLHGASGAATDGYVDACVREQPFQLTEADGGVNYRHLGGVYRLKVRAL